MGKPKAPKPPDPVKTAGAQTGTNIGTAIAQGYMNNINQVTPDGSLQYKTTGHRNWTDPNTGKVFQIPITTAYQYLSPTQRAIKGHSDQAEINMARLAKNQSARLGSLLGTPMEMGNEAVEGRLFDLGRKRLDPMLADQREDLRTQLSNQGIKIGSAAYDREMGRFDERENDAYNNLLLSGRGQAVQETLAERNQPINEITALLSGSQVSQPNFVGTNPPQLANVDRAGLEMANYQGRLNNYNRRMNERSQIMGGLFGLGAGALSGGYL